MVSFNAKIDLFRVAVNGTNIFIDNFNDDTPPPNLVNEVPGGSTFGGAYRINGGITSETGGRAILDSSNAVSGDIIGGDQSKVIVATLPSNITPGGTQGLRMDRNFSVVGRFDLTTLTDDQTQYGVRFSDIQLDTSGAIAAGGDDNAILAVSRGHDGSMSIRFVDRDFLAGTRDVIGSAPLDPGGADQILLVLGHTAGTGEIRAYYYYVTAGVLGAEHQLPGVMKIFGAGTATTVDDEDYTRAQFFVSGLEDTGAKLIEGDENSNTLNGTSADEDFVGFAGDDTMFGNGGTDSIDGRAGNDTAKFVGNRADYVVTQVDATHVLVTGAEGSATVSNTENFQFADVTLSLANVVTPEVELRGNNVVIVDGDLAPDAGDDTAFGSVPQGSPAIHTFTLRNLGAETLTITNLKVPAGFTLLPGSPTSIAAGGSTTFQVQLNTATVGTFSGQVTFNTNDTDEAAFNFGIAGTVVAPEVDVFGNGVGIADNDLTPALTDHTNFGSAELGDAGTIRTFTVFNNGTADLVLSDLVAPTGFTIVEGLSSTIAAGGSDTFQIQLDTASAGTKSGQITFTSNDASEAAYNFAVNGVVTATPEIEVTGNGVVIADNDVLPDGADHTNFGFVTLGQTVVRTFTIANEGNGTLTLASLKLPAGFTLVGAAPTAIAAGDTAQLQVSFTAVSLGMRSGVISFTSNDPDEAAFNFGITAEAVTAPAPEIELRGNNVVIVDGDLTPAVTDHTSFGSVEIGDAGTIRTFTVFNNGTADLVLSDFVAPTGFTIVEGLSSTIAAGGSDTFQIQLDTSSAGTKSGQITFTSNDASEAAYNFAINGVVTATPEIEVTGNGVVIADNDVLPDGADHTNFGSVTLGQTVVRTFTIANEGNGTLTLTALKLPKGFTLVGAAPTAIAAGDTAQLQVSFTAAKLGVLSGVISFTSNDPDEGAFNFGITAQGVTGPAPEVDVFGNGNAIADNDLVPIVTDHTDFELSAFGEPGTIRTFTVTNNGTAALTTSALLVSAGFTIVEGLSASIAVGASDTIQIQLDTAAGTGSKTGQVSFSTNDATEGAYIFGIKGVVGPQNVPGDNTDNTFLATANAENFIGELGSDTVSYENATSLVAVSLTVPANATAGFAIGDTFQSIENLKGSAFNDTLGGDAGDNVIEGGAGADAMNGLGGIDTASYAGSLAGLTANLAGKGNTGDALGDKYTLIENLLGTAFNDVLTGNTLDNKIQGGNGNDVIAGGAGGVDELEGGAGADQFNFLSLKDGADMILDFNAAEEKIGVSEKGFKIPVAVDFGAPAPFNFADNYFVSSTTGAADEAHGQFVYNTTFDQLLWDVDGTGAKAAVLVATFATDVDLQASHFVLLA